METAQLPDTVEGVLKSVADDIEKYGHFQSKPGQKLWIPPEPDGQCCLRINPTLRKLNGAPLYYEVLNEMFARTGGHGLADYRDTHSTDEVLALLRQ